MRARGLRGVIALLGVLYAAGLTMGQDGGQASDLRALEQGKFAALARHDKAALDGMLDDALIGVDLDGSVRGKLDYLANQDARVQLRQMAVTAISVQVSGEVAVVVGIYEEKGLKSGRPYRQRCRFIDTWEWKKGKWVCIGAAVTPVIS